ncbi:hypothetical protein SapgrDRAFT_2723 [Saprospira grandis DSM 2844]|uniref:Uncharacterized protein n=1 Tax=Saprospira grandis DSM 2844 TaxID=694433 RepID=J1I7H3_9BACT|nr:hypothetical protein SapgrDRAFT_2723 [Saprospira grandis DSM 2844]
MEGFFDFKLFILEHYAFQSSNFGLKTLLSFRSSLLFWGLPPAAGATFHSSLFARPFSPSGFGLALAGHCCTSLGRLDELNKKRASKYLLALLRLAQLDLFAFFFRENANHYLLLFA